MRRFLLSVIIGIIMRKIHREDACMKLTKLLERLEYEVVQGEEQ